MAKSPGPRLAALMFAASMLAFQLPAHAQSDGPLQTRIKTAVQKIQDACGADVKAYCGNVSPGEGRLVHCMMAHEDKVSSKCEFSIFEASRNLDRALDRIEQTADSCWDDIEKNCSVSEPGGRRIMQCLASKKSSLQIACQATLARISGSSTVGSSPGRP